MSTATLTKDLTTNAFMRQLTQLVQARRGTEAAAFFDRHSPAVLDRLSARQRFHLDALMEYADTVAELEAAATVRADAVAATDVGEQTPTIRARV